jgi:hypothetical protein
MVHTASKVFYVPQCPVNLLSASLMEKKGNLILDMRSNQIVNRYSRKSVGILEERGELFRLLTNYAGLRKSPARDRATKKTDLHGSSAKAVPNKIQHYCLSHLGYTNFAGLARVTKGIEIGPSHFKLLDNSASENSTTTPSPPQETAPEGES